MGRIFSVSLAGLFLMGWTLSGGVFVDHKGDRGLHKGHYKDQPAKSRGDSKGRR